MRVRGERGGVGGEGQGREKSSRRGGGEGQGRERSRREGRR